MITKLFSSIKSITKSDDNKNTKLKPNTDSHALSYKKSKDKDVKAVKANKPIAVFAGYTDNQIKEQIKNAGQNGSGALTSAVVGQEAINVLDTYKEKEPTVKVAASSSFSDIIATSYSEGDSAGTVDKLKTYLNNNKGAVEKRFWYMLMDIYQVISDRKSFDRVALAFAQSFHASPPSWQTTINDDKRNVMAGNNILILEPTFTLVQTERFKDFLKAAKQEKFCRINVSQCKFEQSEIGALLSLHKLFTQLRRFKVMSVLMGDNNLINFCKSYINPNLANKSLKQHFIEQEDFFWLLYLEILQWKGKHDEFEELAFEYAKKFEISPPGWDNSGVMIYDKIHESKDELTHPELDRVLNSNNIDILFEMIRSSFETHQRAEIDLSSVERIDFATAGAISHFIQEIWTEDEHAKKDVIFKYPNEMLLVLFEMVGVTQFVKIIPKKR